jgi:tRNA-specific 2-thiouridylase
MRTLVAMSGGVDSSVAAALLQQEGHEVVGVTLKLWGGPSDSGCCSVADVDDARRVAQQLGIDHYVLDLADEFTAGVVEPYVAAHAEGRTPNPCIECNRTIKFDHLLRRADLLGFDALATGHHARVVDGALVRGADRAKDQSYVLWVLEPASLARIRFPVGDRTKAEVRALATALGLRTAAKPDSQDVCFVAGSDRAAFLTGRVDFTPGRVVDATGAPIGSVPAVELVTIGQRKGLGAAGGLGPRYAVAVDVRTATVTVGAARELLADEVELDGIRWLTPPVDGPLLAQCSAHGAPRPARIDGDTVRFDEPSRRVAPGQSVVLYDGDRVVGGGIAR